MKSSGLYYFQIFIEVECNIKNQSNLISYYMSELKVDATRKNKSVKLPFQKSYLLIDIYNKGSYDIKKLINFFERQGKLNKEIVLKIIRQTQHLFKMQPNMIRIQSPVLIIGDIHGQFYDLVTILNKSQTNKEKLLFLGDYVDRGYFSIEVLLTLLCIKINYPNRVFLIRGNHQCQQMTSYFNFRQQCLKKYDQEVYTAIMEFFNTMPISGIVDNKYLCVHGGITSALTSLEKIVQINRFQQIPSSGLFCDLVWADPILEPSGIIGPLQQRVNTERGCSYIFGKELASSVLKNINLKCIIRGHQAEQEGFRLFNWENEDQFPQVITIFSAPNYCGFYGNKASLMRIEGNNANIEQFSFQQHPFLLPQFIDAFEWSFPFVAEKVTEMMMILLIPRKGKQFQQDSGFIQKIEIMKKILQYHHKHTTENINWTNLGGLVLDNLLVHDKQAIQYFMVPENLEKEFNFLKKRQIDLKNQKRPIFDSFTKP